MHPYRVAAVLAHVVTLTSMQNHSPPLLLPDAKAATSLANRPGQLRHVRAHVDLLANPAQAEPPLMLSSRRTTLSAMDLVEVEFTRAWRSRVDGPEFEVVAMVAKTRRVIARATVHVSTDTFADFVRVYGDEARASIEQKALEACEDMALRFPGL